MFISTHVVANRSLATKHLYIVHLFALLWHLWSILWLLDKI
jgi:hypothetical protein